MSFPFTHASPLLITAKFPDGKGHFSFSVAYTGGRERLGFSGGRIEHQEEAEPSTKSHRKRRSLAPQAWSCVFTHPRSSALLLLGCMLFYRWDSPPQADERAQEGSCMKHLVVVPSTEHFVMFPVPSLEVPHNPSPGSEKLRVRSVCLPRQNARVTSTPIYTHTLCVYIFSLPLLLGQ